MLVEDLIAKLQTLDPKLRVLSSGYEGGYNDIKIVEPTRVALDVHSEWYYGPHENEHDYHVMDNKDKYTIVDAIFIG